MKTMCVYIYIYNIRVNGWPQAHHPLETGSNSVVDETLTEVNVWFQLGNPSCPHKIRNSMYMQLGMQVKQQVING